MNRRAVGIRFVTGLIVAGGLVAGSMSSTLAAPTQLAGGELAVVARFEQCTEGSNPKKCKPIEPETPSKRGGKPKKDPPRGGNINPPPPPPDDPPTGGRIKKDPGSPEEPRTPRVIKSTGGNSTPFVATHLAIPVVESSQPVAQAAVAQPVAVARPAVSAPPSAGVGPELEAGGTMAGALAALATLFGAGALYLWRRPQAESDHARS